MCRHSSIVVCVFLWVEHHGLFFFWVEHRGLFVHLNQLAKCYRSLPCMDCVATIGNKIFHPQTVLVLKSKISISFPEISFSRLLMDF